MTHRGAPRVIAAAVVLCLVIGVAAIAHASRSKPGVDLQAGGEKTHVVAPQDQIDTGDLPAVTVGDATTPGGGDNPASGGSGSTTTDPTSDASTTSTSSTSTSTPTTDHESTDPSTTTTTNPSGPTDTDPGYHVPTGPTADAVAFGLTPTHAGAHDDPALAAHPKKRWARRLVEHAQNGSSAVGYPLVVDGRVFVTVANGEPNGSLVYGSKLYALNAENGNDLWGPIDLGGTYSFSAVAYDAGRVFVVNYNGLLQAFDASTGTNAWSKQLPGQWSFTTPPTARDGVVYTAGAGSGGTLYAVTEADGALKWTASVANGDSSSPAVTGDGVYVSYPCHVYDFDPTSGATIWHNDTHCSGGGGATTVVHGGKVYARADNIILGASDGLPMGAFTGGPLPAFAGSSGFFVNGGLEAHTVDANAVLWHFAGEQPIVSNAIVVNSVVYAAAGDGTVYGVDAATGKQLWSGSAGGEIDAPDEHNAVQRSAIAEGNGLILVPTMETLVAFG